MVNRVKQVPNPTSGWSPVCLLHSHPPHTHTHNAYAHTHTHTHTHTTPTHTHTHDASRIVPGLWFIPFPSHSQSRPCGSRGWRSCARSCLVRPCCSRPWSFSWKARMNVCTPWPWTTSPPSLRYSPPNSLILALQRHALVLRFSSVTMVIYSGLFYLHSDHNSCLFVYSRYLWFAVDICWQNIF